MKINSIGVAAPERKLDQSEIIKNFCRTTKTSHHREEVLKTLYRKTGIESRHTVLSEQEMQQILESPIPTSHRMKLYEKYAPALATNAAFDAFRQTAIKQNEITHLITVSCTGFFAPGLDCSLVETLFLNPTVSRTHIGFQGCHGVFNALRVANAFVAADPNAVVLLVSVELCSLHLNFTNESENNVANSLFADGASAAILSKKNSGVLSFSHSLSALLPKSSELMSWKIDNQGFVMTLSASLSNLIEEKLPMVVEEWEKSSTFRIKDMQGFAIHPGGPKILNASMRAMRISTADLTCSEAVLKKYGNMSSATVLFVLKELLKNEIPRPYLCLGFGPGISTELLSFI